MKLVEKLSQFFGIKVKKELAKKLGCSYSTMMNWENIDAVGLKWALRIEFLTEGKIKAKDIKPKVFKWIEMKAKKK